MRSLYQVLKASKIDPVSAPDMFTALWAKNISGSGSVPTEQEYTGAVPTPITANGEPLIAWTVYGNQKPYENLWNPNQTITRGYYNDSGVLVDDLTTGHSELMSIGNNTTFTINNLWYNEELKPNFAVYEWDASNQFLRRTNRQYPTDEPITFTTGNNTAYISFQFKLNWNSSGVMLNTGPTALPFVPHDGIPTPTIPIYQRETGDRTENLTFKTISSANISPTGVIQALSGFNLNIAKVKQGQAYSGNGYVYAFFASEPTMGGVSYNAERVVSSCTNVTAPIDGYLAIRVPDDAENQMINEGSTIKPYKPYGYKLPVLCGGVTTNVYTAEPLRKIGDYTDYKSESAEYRAVKKVVLTGNETPTAAAAITDTNAYQFPNETSDYKREPFICSHMVVNTDSTATNTHGYIGQRLTLCFDKAMGLDTTDKVKTYLAEQYNAGTPVCVWYVLATPTTTTVEGPEIPTSNGEQTFDVTTELEPSSVYIKYKG